MRHYALVILKLRFLLLGLTLSLVALSVWALPGVTLDFSVFALVEAGDDAKAKIDEFYSYLPPRPLDAVALLEYEQPMTRADLEGVEALSQALAALPSLKSVTSIADAVVIESSFGVPIPRTLISLPDETSLVEVAGDRSLIAGRLLSRDGKSTSLVLARHPDRPSDVPWMDDVRAIVGTQLPAGVTNVRYMANEIVEDALRRNMSGDIYQSLVLEVICFVILMPLLFGTVRATVIPLLVIACSVLFNLALNVLFGWTVSLIEVSIPGLVTVIVLCDAVHMLHRFEEVYTETGDKRVSILEMMITVGRACLYTSMTTAIGFLSLLVVDNAAIRDFATTAATSVAVGFVCVVTLMPLFLSLAPVGKARGGMRHFVKLSYGRPRLTYIGLALVVLVSAIGISRITIGARWLTELPPHEQVVQDLEWYQDNYNGFVNLDVKLQGKLDSVEAFRAVEKLQDRVLAVPGVTGVESYTTWVREWLGGPEGSLIGPRIAAGLTYLKLSNAAAAFPTHAVTRDFRLGRIRFQTRDVGSGPFLDIIDVVEEEMATLPEGITAEVAGFDRLAHESSIQIIVTMMASLLISTIAISLLIMVIYRSVRMGLIATIPNTLPILVALGLTGLLDIQLRIGIVMIYSVGVGLAVDNTIHLLTRFIQERKEHPGRTVRQHLKASLDTTGNALVASSIVLVIGAFCYLPSSFQSMSDLGRLLSTMVIVALIAEVLLLPHLLERFGGPGRLGRWLGRAQDDAAAS